MLKIVSLILFSIFTISSTFSQQCGLNGVIINEILYNPSDDPDCELEYVELCNTNDLPADLSKCVISDCDGPSGFSFIFPENSVIPPNGYAIVTNNNPEVEDGTCILMGDILVCDIGNENDQLGNVGEQIVFWDGFNYCEVSYGSESGTTQPETDIGCIMINTGNAVGFEYGGALEEDGTAIGRDPDSGSNWVPTSCSPGSGNALPVVLTNFSLKQNDNEVIVTWTTSSEINSSHFDIEWSTNGREFSTIGNVTAAGNSSEVINYRTIHRNPISGVNFYRLNQVDQDGASAYSELRTIRLNLEEKSEVSIYPTAVEHSVNILIPELDKEILYEIVSVSGKVIMSETYMGDNHIKTVDVSNLVSGIYIVRTSIGTEVSSHRFYKK